jgi:hypothetical protein
MRNQLVLLTDDQSADFSIDARTREVGRKGIAAAREALRAAAERELGHTNAKAA